MSPSFSLSSVGCSEASFDLLRGPTLSQSPTCVMTEKKTSKKRIQEACINSLRCMLSEREHPVEKIVNCSAKITDTSCALIQEPLFQKVAKVKNRLQDSLEGIAVPANRPEGFTYSQSYENKASFLLRNLETHQKQMMELTEGLDGIYPQQLQSLDDDAIIEFNGGSLKIARLIGKGGFGRVYQAELLSDTSEKILDVALKVSKVFHSVYKKIDVIDKFKREAFLLKKIAGEDDGARFPIGKLLADFPLNESSYCLVEELYECNLHDMIRKTAGLGVSLSLTYKIAKQLIEALRILESVETGIIHCDVKPENIVLENSFSSKIKLIDFGISLLGPNQNLDRLYLVSRYYRSPEIVFHQPFDTASDRWSLGLTLFELFAGRPLFPARDTTELVYMFKVFFGSIPEALLSQVVEEIQVEFRTDSSIDFNRIKKHYRINEDSRQLFDYVFSQDNIERKNMVRLDQAHKTEYIDLFKLFIEGFLTLDPGHRLTISQLKEHPFMLKMEALIVNKKV
ncbi:MAG: hypothetical protein FJZ57_07015 [Chlamydiae bacterium]|nr:hypothetical protein [Chlamydiota bacterium]